MTEADFIPSAYSKKPESGHVSWESPSNIALVKYWGKYGEQLPMNTSFSFTLSHCKTTTTLHYEEKKNEGFKFEVLFEGKAAPSFEPKILQFFQRADKYLPFLKHYQFIIETSNSFPHSSGIASSASGMSALACCLVDLEQKLFDGTQGKDQEAANTLKASFLARLGSGSACRSLVGPLVVWGKHPDIEGSSNLFGISYPYLVHENFNEFQDTILLVDKGEKQVSSSAGHHLMHGHPFAEQRFGQANGHVSKLKEILEKGDIPAFVNLVESEALSLHAMMLSSEPGFILMKPNTLQILNKIWEFRKETGSGVCFTLDAGANVHVLYPFAEKEKVYEFIMSELVVFCENEQYICDRVGNGAEKV